ncbi:hypothetical protein D3C85_871780 [compost metagenome]
MIKPDRSTDTRDYGFFRCSQVFTGTSEVVYMKNDMPHTSAAIHPQSGTAKIQFSLSSAAEIEAGRGLWIDWPKGSVAVSTADSLVSAVIAVRGVATATATMEVCAR